MDNLNRLILSLLLYLVSAHLSLALGDVYKFVGQGGEVFYTAKVKSAPRKAFLSYSSGRSVARMDRVDPAFRRDYSEMVSRIAKNHGLDPDLLHAVIQAESA